MSYVCNNVFGGLLVYNGQITAAVKYSKATQTHKSILRYVRQIRNMKACQYYYML